MNNDKQSEFAHIWSKIKRYRLTDDKGNTRTLYEKPLSELMRATMLEV